MKSTSIFTGKVLAVIILICIGIIMYIGPIKENFRQKYDGPPNCENIPLYDNTVVKKAKDMVNQLKTINNNLTDIQTKYMAETNPVQKNIYYNQYKNIKNQYSVHINPSIQEIYNKFFINYDKYNYQDEENIKVGNMFVENKDLLDSSY